MFAALEIIGFIAAAAVSIYLWRSDAGRLLRFVVVGSWLALGGMVLTAAFGVPLFFHRFVHAQLGADVVSIIASVHHDLGHWFIIAFALFWPALFVASVARPVSAQRKMFLGAAAVFCMFLFLFLSITGYLLPSGMPRRLVDPDAAHALRFFVLHVVLTPIMAATVLAAIAWRHARAKAAKSHLRRAK